MKSKSTCKVYHLCICNQSSAGYAAIAGFRIPTPIYVVYKTQSWLEKSALLNPFFHAFKTSLCHGEICASSMSVTHTPVLPLVSSKTRESNSDCVGAAAM
jgi:hypothetical protein